MKTYARYNTKGEVVVFLECGDPTMNLDNTVEISSDHEVIKHHKDYKVKDGKLVKKNSFRKIA